MSRRLLGAIALLAVGCGGLLFNQGNDFPCDFNAAESERDKACAPTEVCSVLNKCERFVYEGPQFEGIPNLPQFDGGGKVHPLVLDRPVQFVTANASQRNELLVVLAAGDGGSQRSVSMQIGKLTLVREASFDATQLEQVAVAGGSVADGYFGATLLNSGAVRVLDGGAFKGPDGGDLQVMGGRALRVGPDQLGLLRGRGPAQVATAVVADSLLGATALRPPAADGSILTVIDFRFVPVSRKLAEPDRRPVALTSEGFFLPEIQSDAGISYRSLTPSENAASLAIPAEDHPRPNVFYLRHDLSGSLWSYARPRTKDEKPTVLSTWQLTRQGEAPVSMARAWNDCSPCLKGRILAIAPNLDDLANVEVLCGSAEDDVSLVRVVGALSADASDPCVTQSVAPAFNLSRQTLFTTAARGIVIDDANGGGVLLGGTHGEIWSGPSFSRALPAFLERVPLAFGSFRTDGVELPFVVTDRYVAAPLTPAAPGALANGFKVFDLRLASDFVLDDDVRLRSLVGGAPGWGVLSSADLTRLSIRKADVDGGVVGSGNLFSLSYGPRMVNARGEPARSPYFGEAVTTPDGGLVSLVLTADDSVYLSPAPEESSAPNSQQPLFPLLTPEPGSPIRSFALERTRLGTDGVKRVRGYAVTSRNLFTVALAGEPARWTATPLLLSAGEPLEVWMDNPRGGLGRVGYRDGNVFSLPGGFQLVRPAGGEEPRQILDYENLGGWPVAYATSGLWVAFYDLTKEGTKLDNKLPDGRPGKPMQWRPVTMSDGTRPWMDGATARPGRLHVLVSPPSKTTSYEQQFQLFLYLDDAVYEVGSMVRKNASPPPSN